MMGAPPPYPGVDPNMAYPPAPTAPPNGYGKICNNNHGLFNLVFVLFFFLFILIFLSVFSLLRRLEFIPNSPIL